jgi:hypothetical protein
VNRPEVTSNIDVLVGKSVTVKFSNKYRLLVKRNTIEKIGIHKRSFVT